MIGAVVALALFAQARQTADVTREFVPVRGWTLEVRRDRFSGETSCAFRTRDIALEKDVFTFSFPATVNTANAMFRVDDGRPQAIGPLGPEAAGLGVALSSDDLRNPSGGRVHIPARHLQGANSLRIRPNLNDGDKIFGLGGLKDALALAATKGCSPQG
jgi:hypothetical protein